MSTTRKSSNADDMYKKKLEDKLGAVVTISLKIPTKIFEDFAEYAVGDGHLDINSALIQVMRDVSNPKKSKVQTQIKPS